MNVLRSVVTVGNYSEEDNRSKPDNDYCGDIIARKAYFHEWYQNRETRVVLGLYGFSL
jgi:hypothetical protein